MLQSLNNAEENQNNGDLNSELIENHELANTPFRAVGSPERGYFLALGRFKLSDNYKNVKDIEQFLKKEFYNVVLRMIAVVSESIEQTRNSEKNSQPL